MIPIKRDNHVGLKMTQLYAIYKKIISNIMIR